MARRNLLLIKWSSGLEIRSTMAIKYIKVDSSTKVCNGRTGSDEDQRDFLFSLDNDLLKLIYASDSNRGLFSSGLLAYIFNSRAAPADIEVRFGSRRGILWRGHISDILHVLSSPRSPSHDSGVKLPPGKLRK
jgi:hypothetical protein